MRRLLAGFLAFLWLITAASAQVVMPTPLPPAGASGIVGSAYASSCSAVVNTSTSTSTFCPNATDSTSNAKRTMPAAGWVVGKAFKLEGGGPYSVPTGNTLPATVTITVNSTIVMTITTAAAPVTTATGSSADFWAICRVVLVSSVKQIACHGQFTFTVAGATTAPLPFDQVSNTTSGTSTPDLTVDGLIDVKGNWVGTVSSQNTTVTQAVLTVYN